MSSTLTASSHAHELLTFRLPQPAAQHYERKDVRGREDNGSGSGALIDGHIHLTVTLMPAAGVPQGVEPTAPPMLRIAEQNPGARDAQEIESDDDQGQGANRTLPGSVHHQPETDYDLHHE